MVSAKRQCRRIVRNCDQCGRAYPAEVRRVKVGLGRFCSPHCANAAPGRIQKKRRKSRLAYWRNNAEEQKIKQGLRAHHGNRCARCGKRQVKPGLHVHRIVPEEQGGEYTTENTMLLCVSCHPIVEWERWRGTG